MIQLGSRIVLKKKYWKSHPGLHRMEPFTVIDISEREYKVEEGYWIAEELMEDVFSVNLKKVLE